MAVSTHRVYVAECETCGDTLHATTDYDGVVATGMHHAPGENLGPAMYRREFLRDVGGLGWTVSRCVNCRGDGDNDG